MPQKSERVKKAHNGTAQHRLAWYRMEYHTIHSFQLQIRILSVQILFYNKWGTVQWLFIQRNENRDFLDAYCTYLDVHTVVQDLHNTSAL